MYFKKINDDDGQMKQKMTMFLPKSCEGIEFPVQDLTGFFSMFAGVEGDIESHCKRIVSKTFISVS